VDSKTHLAWQPGFQKLQPSEDLASSLQAAAAHDSFGGLRIPKAPAQ
jgi:hypothetical protein